MKINKLQIISFKKHLTLIILILLFGLNAEIFSQEEEKVNKVQETNINEKAHQFGFTIKRATYTYYPEEYQNTKLIIDPYKDLGLFKLRNNTEIINPFSFYYYNANKNLYFELSHYKLILTDPYYYSYSGGTLQPAILNSIKRAETKLNVYSSVSLNTNNHFFYGIGYRNLSKDQSRPYQFSELGYTTSTNGIQGFLKYKFRIFSLLSLNLSLEPFYTFGSQKIYKPTGAVFGNSWQYNYNSNVNVYFYGTEIDANLSFQLNENLSFITGYNYTYTKVRYENERYFSITYANGEFSYLNIFPPFHSNIDHIKNYYIGLNAKF